MAKDEKTADAADVTDTDSGTSEAGTDPKAAFREALARKQQQHADGVGSTGPASSKIHEAHGPVGAKRQFRRKSGG
ncbi:DUF5302 domain-containing protein [Jatrophihabitans telluris]|uniref:DUF5302 domain-containing protein n=1 Tax=Jatrophihabitans telluris TaxID=2038343 RepID=A0ABY4QUL4_9ACTN|nr:DUF5302 domain-containing protein [Jatrophihabitans telluris]UQX87319.1 DUF5302 domain-containing protein [Jatrophihabitans telluris]